MSEYNEGDLVEAVKGDTVLRARMISNEGTGWSLRMETPLLRFDARYLEDNGYTVTTIEKAKPALPTEPGLYRVGGSNAGVEGTVQLAADGQWWWIGNAYKPSVMRLAHVQASSFAPVTRLEPVAETAKKVLDALGEYLDGQLSGRTKNDIIKFIGDEFGVTS